MNIDLLKTLIESACSDGEISAHDRAHLAKQAQKIGVEEENLNFLIESEIRKHKKEKNSEQSGFVKSSPTENNTQSGFVTSNEAKELSDDGNKSDFTNIETLEVQGSMGLIQKARFHDKWIILKRIKPEYKDNTQYRSLFEAEFENAYHLEHPHIIKILDKGEDEEGLYLTMEFVDGRPLSSLIGPDGIENHDIAFRIFRQLLDAVGYMHKKQIIHRDLKPENILITYRGDNVKLLDFGLALSEQSNLNLKFAGTSEYASPEQKSDSRFIDQRSDIYTLGLILLKMLTGKQQTGIEFDRLPLIVKSTISRCLKKDPKLRFHNCENINTLFNNLNIKTMANSSNQSFDSGNSGSSNKIILIVIIAIVVASLGFGYYYYTNHMQKDKKEIVDNDTKDDKTKDDKKNDEKEQGKEDIKNILAEADDYLQNKDFEKAKELYEKALEVKENDSDILNKIDICSVGIFLDKADAEKNDKNIIAAKRYAESALEIMSDNQTAQNIIDECDKIISKTSGLKPEKGDNGLMGFRDKSGYLIVDYIYEDAWAMQWALAAVKIDGKWGFIGPKGKLLVETRYDKIDKLAPGYKAYDNTDNVKHLVSNNTGKLKVKAF